MIGHLRRLLWACRRLGLPVGPKALVLEIGAGHNPYPRTNVAVEMRLDTRERLGSIALDRPVVLARGEKLPFKDKVFDFVVASHVLEHSPDQRAFLNEMERVGKAGYIETLAAVREHLMPAPIHRLEVFTDGAKLFIRKKTSPLGDRWVAEAFRRSWGERAAFRHFHRDSPSAIATAYHWQGSIDFEIENEEVDAAWPLPSDLCRGQWSFARSGLVRLLRRLLGTRCRIDLAPLLKCSSCRGDGLERYDGGFACEGCGKKCPDRRVLPCFL